MSTKENFKWTKCQAEALENIKSWIKSDDYFYRVKGYAGTGKTTLTSAVFKLFTGVTAITAPTHQATSVISEKTGIEGRTIQSLLGLAPNVRLEDFDVNNPQFSVINREIIKDYHSLVVDEASMLPSDLLVLLKDAAVNYKVKVLFVYDDAQLPPVGEDIIPIDEDDTIGISVLTEVIRQAEDNPLLEVLTNLRNNIKSTKPITIASRATSKGGVIVSKGRDKFESTVISRFLELSKKGLVHTEKVLTFSNSSTAHWNKVIRKALLTSNKTTNPIDNFFMVNETITSYTTLKDSIIKNSGVYRILKIVPTKIKMKYKEVKDRKFGDRELEVDLKVFRLTVASANDKSAQEVIDVLVSTSSNFAAYYKVFNFRLMEAKIKNKWQSFLTWRDQVLLFSDLTNRGKLLARKDLDYAYACTIHKSQGSTYKNVYVNLPDILKLENVNFVRAIYEEEKRKSKRNMLNLALFERRYPNFKVYYNNSQHQKNRLLYVALSRPEGFSVVLSDK